MTEQQPLYHTAICVLEKEIMKLECEEDRDTVSMCMLEDAISFLKTAKLPDVTVSCPHYRGFPC